MSGRGENVKNRALRLLAGLLLSLALLGSGLVCACGPAGKGSVAFRKACFAFPNGSGELLFDIDLEIHPGEFVVVNGESGCGKSTLLNMIGCMDELTEGKLEIFGRDMTKISEKERTLYRRRDVGCDGRRSRRKRKKVDSNAALRETRGGGVARFLPSF